MKRTVLVVIIILFSTVIFAQKVSGGLFVGPNLSWYTFDSKVVENEGVKLGYQFGAMIDFNLVDNFILTTGLNFNSVGGSQTYLYGVQNFRRKDLPDETLAAGSTIKYMMDYVEIPIGFRGQTNEIGYLTYFLKAGVSPGVNIKSRVDVTVDSNDIIDKESKIFNMGWYIGGGFTWSLQGNTRLLTEIVYTGGILDTDNTEAIKADGTSGNIKAAISSVALRVGILF